MLNIIVILKTCGLIKLKISTTNVELELDEIVDKPGKSTSMENLHMISRNVVISNKPVNSKLFYIKSKYRRHNVRKYQNCLAKCKSFARNEFYKNGVLRKRNKVDDGTFFKLSKQPKHISSSFRQKEKCKKMDKNFDGIAIEVKKFDNLAVQVKKFDNLAVQFTNFDNLAVHVPNFDDIAVQVTNFCNGTADDTNFDCVQTELAERDEKIHAECNVLNNEEVSDVIHNEYCEQYSNNFIAQISGGNTQDMKIFVAVDEQAVHLPKFDCDKINSKSKLENMIPKSFCESSSDVMNNDINDVCYRDLPVVKNIFNQFHRPPFFKLKKSDFNTVSPKDYASNLITFKTGEESLSRKPENGYFSICKNVDPNTVTYDKQQNYQSNRQSSAQMKSEIDYPMRCTDIGSNTVTYEKICNQAPDFVKLESTSQKKLQEYFSDMMQEQNYRQRSKKYMYKNLKTAERHLEIGKLEEKNTKVLNFRKLKQCGRSEIKNRNKRIRNQNIFSIGEVPEPCLNFSQKKQMESALESNTAQRAKVVNFSNKLIDKTNNNKPIVSCQLKQDCILMKPRLLNISKHFDQEYPGVSTISRKRRNFVFKNSSCMKNVDNWHVANLERALEQNYDITKYKNHRIRNEKVKSTNLSSKQCLKSRNNSKSISVLKVFELDKAAISDNIKNDSNFGIDDFEIYKMAESYHKTLNDFENNSLCSTQENEVGDINAEFDSSLESIPEGKQNESDATTNPANFESAIFSSFVNQKFTQMDFLHASSDLKNCVSFAADEQELRSSDSEQETKRRRWKSFERNACYN